MAACESCRLQARTLFRATVRASIPKSPARAATASKALLRRLNYQSPAPVRFFSNSGRRGLLGGIGESYRVLGASERLFKACAKPADYRITEEERKSETVKKMEDGEEMGQALEDGNVWHKSKYTLVTTHIFFMHHVGKSVS